MAYLSKNTLLAAYQILSDIDKDKNQGLTQKVSALKYEAALDIYFKNHGTNCDLKVSASRDVFTSYVGKIVRINEIQCTKDFYTNVAPNGRDYDCGSNFYSQSSVKNSKTNTTETFTYPKRSGWKPVMDVKNQVLVYNKNYIKSSIDYYLPSSLYRAAFVVWLLRFDIIQTKDTQGLRNALLRSFTVDYCNALFPIEDEKNIPSFIEYADTKCILTEDDIKGLFNNRRRENTIEDMSYQQIFYGAPGTGKSHRIKEYLKGKNVPAENIFRTTFHPDSDYSTFVGAYKPTMKKQYRYDGRVKAKYYEDDDLAGAKQDDVIVDKVIHYDFVPQTFVKAYVRAYQTDENVYLVIEEINRGNCAQIFGDLFQLLDRDENGVSDYTVKADDDLRVYLEDVLGKDNKGIKDGELCLPANLYIFATMNTSDQSLFPIDSAFKRRWDWEYEPIKYKNTDWVIEIGGNEYSWVSFQKEVNNRIFEATNSEDKMLGDYFVKPHNGIISEKLLLNKVLFYLWNDVCKDGDGDIFKIDENKDVKFSDLYGENGTKVLLSMMKHLGVSLVSESDEEEWEDEEEKGDGIKKRYSINGEEKDENGKDWKKGTLVKRAVEIYCNNHRQDTAIQVRDAWMSLGFLIPHIVETDEDKRLRIVSSNDSRAEKRSKPIKLFNGEFLHVSTQVGDGAQYRGFSDFLLKIQSKPEWGIDIQEL